MNHLEIDDCDHLINSLDNLTKLTHLHINYYDNISRTCFDKLMNLTHLEMNGYDGNYVYHRSNR